MFKKCTIISILSTGFLFSCAKDKAKDDQNRKDKEIEQLERRIEEANLSEDELTKLREELANSATDIEKLNKLISELEDANRKQKELTIQGFMDGLQDNRIFVADSSEISNKLGLVDQINCRSILAFADNVTTVNIEGVPDGLKLPYNRLLVCRDSEDSYQIMSEKGILTNFVSERTDKAIMVLVTDNQKCKSGDEKLTLFGGRVQSFIPRKYEIAGIETVNTNFSSTTGPSQDNFSVEHNMAQTLPGIYSSTCEKLMDRSDADPLVKIGCKRHLKLDLSDSVKEGCFEIKDNALEFVDNESN